MTDYDAYYNDYFNEEDKKRLARLLMISRAESCLSQEHVAYELGIAKKTVQNWERGVSAPSLPQAIAWFKVMGVAALPYFLQYMYPEMEGTNAKDSDEKIKTHLIKLIESLPTDGVRQLMYLFYGNHGSSPRAVMNMVTAHLQTPLRQRYSHAAQILSDYKIAKHLNQIVQPENIQPNIEILEHAVDESRNAILEKKDIYSIFNSNH